ncbi:hypothetical protein OPV22_028027 [Ensete ventricosum]|uniref:Uncharacterized protein n=1 Tax=Ensete ventricosum TaxID=4639 RepID=A0AAV8Q1J2_ENSVE|nr:hypothetical protein OPV22_028027 [Ensete ventricosum]
MHQLRLAFSAACESWNQRKSIKHHPNSPRSSFTCSGVDVFLLVEERMSTEMFQHMAWDKQKKICEEEGSDKDL